MLPRQSVKFGFLTGKKVPCPNFQLQNLLKLQNNEDAFEMLKATMERLLVKHLNINYLASYQEEGMKAIQAELKSEYPHIFATEDSEKRLYFASRVVLHNHHSRRHRLKRRQFLQTLPLRVTRRQRNPPSGVLDPTAQSISQPILNRSMDANFDATSSANGIVDEHHHRYRPIYDFLEASVPPMTHLMDAFIDFGCVNVDFLMAISSWSPERIRNVLNQIPPGQNGRKMTEMDKFILQNHFKQYFIGFEKKE